MHCSPTDRHSPLLRQEARRSPSGLAPPKSHLEYEPPAIGLHIASPEGLALSLGDDTTPLALNSFIRSFI